MSPGQQRTPSKGTVCGVEPDPVTRKLIQMYLEPLGYAVGLESEVADLERKGHQDCVALVLSLDYAVEHNKALFEPMERLHTGIPVIGVASSDRALENDLVMTHFPRVLFKPL